jgi:hypothetical protein
MREMPGKMTKVPRKKGEELGPTMHVRMLLRKSRLQLTADYTGLERT